MKRRDFLKLGTLAAASAQAKQFDAAAQAIFDEQMGLCANKFGAFYVQTIGGRVVGTEPFEGDAMPTVLNNALSDHIQNETRVKYHTCAKASWLVPQIQNPSFAVKSPSCALAGTRR